MKKIIFLVLVISAAAYASSFDKFNSVMLENIQTVIEHNPEHFEEEGQADKAARTPASVIEKVSIGSDELYNSENLDSESVHGKSGI